MSQPIPLQHAFELALRNQQSGNLREAESIYRQILAAHPNHPDALHLLGVLAMQVGRPDAAVELIQRAVGLNPSSPDFQCNLGSALQATGRADEAIAAMNAAIQLRPQFPQAYFNLGNAHQSKRQLSEATEMFRKAVDQEPNYPAAWNNLGNAQHESGHVDEALASIQHAISLQPVFPEAFINLGKILQEKLQFTEAIAAMRTAIEQYPRQPIAHFNLGNGLCLIGEYEQAIKSYRRAIALDPKMPEAHFYLGVSLLLIGDYENGWVEYESRWDVAELQLKRRQLASPEWDGIVDLNGKRILLYNEQGFGDFIQFSRYIPLLAARGATVILVSQQELKRLMTDLEGVKQIISYGENTPPFDTHSPLMSLPKLFRTAVSTIPAEIPYLRANAELIEHWRAKISEEKLHGLKVGLFWAGRSTYKDDHNRRMSLKLLEPLAGISNIHFFSLQQGPASEQMKDSAFHLIDWTNGLNDFADTAALIANLDVIISVDTAVAHLAGAMGKPVWIFLPFAPDWRWMLNRSDSPWYPTARLFRQKARGDWSTPVADVVQALQELKITSK